MAGPDAPKTNRGAGTGRRPSIATIWVVVAVGTRLVAALRYARTPVGFHDPFFYRIAAVPIAEGRGYRSSFGELTAYYPPGYPHLLGFLQRVADAVGHSDALVGAAVVFQALLWGLVTWATMSTARRLWSWRVAAVAGGFVALWPNLILHSTVLLTETLYLALLSCLVLAVVVLAQAASSIRPPRLFLAAAGSGVLLGLAALVRPQVLLLAPLLAVAPAVTGTPWRRTVLVGATMAAVCVSVIMPWSLRNQSVFDQRVAISTNGGDNLCMGFHDGASGQFEFAPACDTGEIYTAGPEAEYRRNQEASRRAREWISTHPSELPLLSVKKLWNTYNGDVDALRAVESYGEDEFLVSAERSAWRVASQLFYMVVMVGVIAGLVRTIVEESGPGRGLRRWFVAAMIVSAAVPILVFGEQRFKVPTASLLAVVAAAGVDAAWSRAREPADRVAVGPAVD